MRNYALRYVHPRAPALLSAFFIEYGEPIPVKSGVQFVEQPRRHALIHAVPCAQRK